MNTYPSSRGTLRIAKESTRRPKRGDSKFDKQVANACSFAREQRCTMVIEREIKDKDGRVVRREPVLEVSPSGDVSETPAPRMTSALSNCLANDRMRQLAAEAQRLLAEEQRRARRQPATRGGRG